MPEFGLEPVELSCPYCGQQIELLVECSEGEQGYVEDCQVCCRPMNVHVQVDGNGMPTVRVTHEDEA